MNFDYYSPLWWWWGREFSGAVPPLVMSRQIHQVKLLLRPALFTAQNPMRPIEYCYPSYYEAWFLIEPVLFEQCKKKRNKQCKQFLARWYFQIYVYVGTYIPSILLKVTPPHHARFETQCALHTQSARKCLDLFDTQSLEHKLCPKHLHTLSGMVGWWKGRRCLTQNWLGRQSSNALKDPKGAQNPGASWAISWTALNLCDKVSGNTASWKPQCNKKSDGSEDARSRFRDIPYEPSH